MKMRGKLPIFGYKDTYSLCDTFDPIIYQGLKKFKEVVTSSDHPWGASTPCKVLCELFPDAKNFTNEQSEQGHKVWLDYLDEMIYAFKNKEPDISEYKFTFVEGEGHGEKTSDGFYQYNMEADNQEEYDRYKDDCKEHEERVEFGRGLFIKFYSCLWW